MQEGSLFSTPSPAFMVCRFFDDGHSDQCEVIPHCSFDLHSLMISDVEHQGRFIFKPGLKHLLIMIREMGKYYFSR